MRTIKHLTTWVAGFLLILAACESDPSPTSDASPFILPTRFDATRAAQSLGIPPQETVDAALTARAVVQSPTATATDTDLPTPETLPPATETPAANAAERIVYASSRAGSEDIWFMALDGSTPRPLVQETTSNEISATCSKTGDRLIFDSDRSGDREIYLRDLVQVSVRPLTDTIGENYHPVWSPTDETVAFVSTRAGNSDIWLMDSGGGNARPLTQSLSEDLMPSWRADGRALVYTSNRDGNFELYEYDLTTATERRLTLTPAQDEFFPAYAPNLTTIAYVAETRPGDVNSASVYLWRSAETPELVISVPGGGRVEMPFWLSQTQLLVSVTVEGLTNIVQVDLTDDSFVTLTIDGALNRWPRTCFITPDLVAVLSAEPTPTPSPTLTLLPTITPSPTATLAPPPLFQIAEPQANWIRSSETWIGNELGFIAPDALSGENFRTFLVDNLINLVWEDAAGTHVLSMAIEAFRGGLETTLIGYTVNDLPGPSQDIIGLDQQVNEKILLNSIRPGLYFLENIEITTVNITFTFRVPIQRPTGGDNSFIPRTGDLPADWLISTERWTTDEVFLIARDTIFDGLAGILLDGDQIRLTWTDNEGTHVLFITVTAENGDLIISPAAYTINDTPAEVEPVINSLSLLREMLLFNSIAPGEFSLTRVAFSGDTIELNFLVAPQ